MESAAASRSLARAADAASKAVPPQGLPMQVAEAVARAVLSSHDQLLSHRHLSHRHEWQEPDFQEYLRRRMRLDLFTHAADEGVVPAALPVEKLRYLADAYPLTPGGGGQEVPAALAESGAAVWEAVEVTLTMPVRHPLPAAPARGEGAVLPAGRRCPCHGLVANDTGAHKAVSAPYVIDDEAAARRRHGRW
ncbi:hypothetical protein GCM10022252_75110 [Streptosporangium oxazolinicum]|uniref:Uncharacterized protein n=1 Tax=Streptosporangium oxazolinicum TaxID=909287 RepID=A0ABP8BL45_9ACTN